MKNLTTPQAILLGLGLIALSIASVPYSSQIIKPAFAFGDVQKIAICNSSATRCANVETSSLLVKNTGKWIVVWKI